MKIVNFKEWCVFFIKFIFLIGILTSCDFLTEEDKNFNAALESNLKHEGDIVQVSKVMAGSWSHVCQVAAYNRPATTIHYFANIPLEKIIIKNTEDDIATDSLWGYVFYYPPYSAEYYKISDAKFSNRGGEECIAREDAFFELEKSNLGDHFGLKLVKGE